MCSPHWSRAICLASLAFLGLSASHADVTWSGAPQTLSGSPEDDIHFTGNTVVTLNGPDATIGEGFLFNESAAAQITLTVNNGADAVQRTLSFFGTQMSNNAVNSLVVSGSSHVRLGGLAGAGNASELIKNGGTGELILDQPTDGSSATPGVVLRAVNGTISVIGGGNDLSPLANVTNLNIDGPTGKIRLGSSGLVGTTFANSLIVNDSGTLEHTAGSADVLGGSVTVALSKVLTANITAGSLTVNGNLNSHGTLGNPGFIKTGAGTLTLNSASVSNVDALAVNGGRMEFKGRVAFGSLPSIAAGATLALSYAPASAPYNTMSATTFAVPSGTLELVPGALGDPAGSNNVSLSGGTLRLASLSTLSYPVTASGTSGIDVALASSQLAALTLQPGTTLNKTSGQFTATAFTLNGVGTYTIGVTGSDFKVPSLSTSGGATNLVKTGTGTLEISTTVNSTGTTTISQGTLRVGNGGAAGALPTGAITDNGNLEFKRSDTVTISAAITGSGAVTNAGTGTLNLTGTQAYSTLNVNSGITNLSRTLTGASPTINVQGGQLNVSASQALSALTIGAGGVATMQASGGFAEFGSGDLGKVDTALIPEPSSLALLACGGLLLGRRRRR
jgi:autotransporter-associated beta strand protein